MIKNVKKKGRVQHLPDSCLWKSLEQKEPSEMMKYKELLANTVPSSAVDVIYLSTDMSQVGVALFPSF